MCPGYPTDALPPPLLTWHCPPAPAAPAGLCRPSLLEPGLQARGQGGPGRGFWPGQAEDSARDRQKFLAGMGRGFWPGQEGPGLCPRTGSAALLGSHLFTAQLLSHKPLRRGNSYIDTRLKWIHV